MSPRPGHFILYNSAEPPLHAGRHVVNASIDLHPASNKTFDIDELDTHVEVTAPRYALSPSELLSTFPPANAVGAFNERLPQVVLKQRTLPWVRQAEDGDAETPWLALVVLAETEAQWHHDRPVAECSTANLSGRNDVPLGSCVVVSQEVIDRVFPTKDELSLLAHVREVDLSDTELALGDDDGFLAVVMANRLPQFDPVTNGALAYRACLISVEGQLDVLPVQQPSVSTFDVVASVEDVRSRVALAIGDLPPSQQQAVVSNQTTTVVSTFIDRSGVVGASAPSAVAGPTVEAQLASLDLASPAVQATLSSLQFRTFPVLAQWRFTCAASGSFEKIMQNLDVGLLGTEPAPSDLPGGRRVEVTETGHVSLDHLTRRGQEVTAWFRGPLTPHRIVRELPSDPPPGESEQRLPLAHTSDQLRGVTPEGTEDLTRASGFEIGRLLALSNPAVVAAMMRWRRKQFGRARQEQQNAMFTNVTGLGLINDFREVVGHVVNMYHDPSHTFPPYRPPVIAGRPVLDFIPDELPDWDRIVTDGFGFEELLWSNVSLDGGLTEGNLADLASAVGSARMAELSDTPLNFEALESAAIGEVLRGITSVAENQDRLVATFEGLDDGAEIPAVFDAVRGSDISIASDAVIGTGGVLSDDGENVIGVLGVGSVIGGISDVIDGGVIDGDVIDGVIDGGVINGGAVIDGAVIDGIPGVGDLVLDLTDTPALDTDGLLGDGR